MTRWIGLARSLVIYHNPLRMRGWRRFYGNLLAPGDLVFDVGAHVGSRARAMRAAGARVIALEPQQPFAGFLRRTLPSDIVLIEAAAGPCETEAEMAVSSRHPTVSSLQSEFVRDAAEVPGFEHVRWDLSQRVRVVALDDLIGQFGVPRYVKIDVEGFELDVLSGLSQPVELLSVEYLPGFAGLSRAVIDRLMQMAPYCFNPIRGESGGFLWPEWRSAPETLSWLDGLPADAPSGDLFARCAEPGPA